MLDADEGTEVPSASANVAVSPQYFDGGKLVGDGLAKAIGMSETWWDVYLFYPPGATWGERGLPVPEYGLAQMVGVVVGTPASLPPVPDQSKLPAELRGKAVVVGAQARFEELLERVATAFVAKTRTPR